MKSWFCCAKMYNKILIMLCLQIWKKKKNLPLWEWKRGKEEKNEWMNVEKERGKGKRNKKREGGKSGGVGKGGFKMLQMHFGLCSWLVGIKGNFVGVNNIWKLDWIGLFN